MNTSAIFLMMVGLHIPPAEIPYKDRIEVKIYLDDGFNSKWLKSELERDWLYYLNDDNRNYVIRAWQAQHHIKSRWHIEYINKYDQRFVESDEYPFYTLNHSTEKHYYDNKSFTSDGYPLLFTEYLVYDYDWPLYKRLMQRHRLLMLEKQFNNNFDAYYNYYVPKFSTIYKRVKPWEDREIKHKRMKKRFAFLDKINAFSWFEDYAEFKFNLFQNLMVN